jgi:hypothetical protein
MGERIAMLDTPSTNIPPNTVLAEITFVPTEDEENDFETISTIGDVTADVFGEMSTIEGYTSKMTSNHRRNAGVILLFHEIAHQVIAQKDLIIAFLQAGTAAIGIVSKHGHVKKIEVSLDGDSISIDDADTVTVQRLLDLFEAKHPGIATKVTPSSRVEVTGKVSKTARPVGK